MSDEEPCSDCVGTGEIIKEVHGRTGFVSCPYCDNEPDYNDEYDE